MARSKKGKQLLPLNKIDHIHKLLDSIAAEQRPNSTPPKLFGNTCGKNCPVYERDFVYKGFGYCPLKAVKYLRNAKEGQKCDVALNTHGKERR